MKYIMILFAIILFIIFYYEIKVLYTKHISKELILETIPYENLSNDYTKTMLVLGDSTAVGVGASNKYESIPGLLADKLNIAYTENYAVSGAKVENLNSQVDQIKRDSYDVVLVQIGANDIVARNNAKTVSAELETILTKLSSKSQKIIFLTAGNMGSPWVIPFFLEEYYTNLTLSYQSKFESLADKLGITFVSLYEDESVDPFVKNPEKYYSRDRFHPSSAGYAHWFEKVSESL